MVVKIFRVETSTMQNLIGNEGGEIFGGRTSYREKFNKGKFDGKDGTELHIGKNSTRENLISNDRGRTSYGKTSWTGNFMGMDVDKSSAQTLQASPRCVRINSNQYGSEHLLTYKILWDV